MSAKEGASALKGRKVIVTRAQGQGDALSALLRAAGAEPIEYPCIAIAPPADPAALLDAIARLRAGAFDWLVLTSANAVRALMQGKGQGARSNGVASGSFAHSPLPIRLAAVGPATAAAARELLGIEPAVVPEAFVAEALAAAMGDVGGQRVLLLNSAIARPALAALLAEAGAHVERVVAYRTVTASGGADVLALLAAGEVDAITFTSSSTVRAFAERVGAAGLGHARRTTIACIGPVTAQAARDQGLPPTVVAATSTVEGLVAALANALGDERGGETNDLSHLAPQGLRVAGEGLGPAPADGATR
jgi:uroporphyrinogen-III synthase